VDRALKLLSKLCLRGTEATLVDQTPVRILVADDEPLARRAVVGALQLAFEKPDEAEDGAAACAFAEKKSYDIIFTDAQMPLMDGFTVCKEIRAGKLNRETPVVFVISCADSANEARAFESGANDFIGKPFLPIEIAVKALTFTWERRLRNISAGAASSPAQAEPRASAGGSQSEPTRIATAA
jgi:PleD family two-component response regulator